MQETGYLHRMLELLMSGDPISWPLWGLLAYFVWSLFFGTHSSNSGDGGGWFGGDCDGGGDGGD